MTVPVDDQRLVTAGLSTLLAASGHRGPLTLDRPLTAGANRRTFRLLLGQAEGPPRPVIAQIVVSRDEPAVTRPASVEAAVVTAAAGAGVPVAEVLAAGRSPELDADVLITAEVPGETIPRRVLRSVDDHPDAADGLTWGCGQALARLHTIDVDHLPEFEEPLPVHTAGGYIDHLRERLEQLPHPHPVFRFGLNLLGRRLPEGGIDGGLSPVHGDVRTGNLIVDATASGAAVLAAVLDWELVHLGDPMEDLAWLCLRTWRFGRDRREVGGFGTIPRLREAYEAAGGRWDQDRFQWWTVARTIWWGIGLAGQAAAFVDGRSTSLVHAASGRRVVELEYDLLHLLAP